MKNTKLFSMLVLCAVIVLAGCKKEPDPTYTVTVTAGANGSAQADKTSARAGETVKLTATPDPGYSFDEWVVESGNVEFSDNKQASANFTMPAGNVSVKAAFTLIVTELTLVWDGFTQFRVDDVEKIDVTTGGSTQQCTADKGRIILTGKPTSIEKICIHVPGSTGTITLGSGDLTLTGSVISVTRDISGVNLVYDPATLKGVGELLSGKYLQTCDIDLSAVDTWIPIGCDEENPFTGTYDGAGYRIVDLKVDSGNDITKYVGLFGYNKGALSNISVDGGSVTGNGQDFIGGVCGYNYLGTISGCTNSAEVGGEAVYGIGGVCGYNYLGTISGCTNSAEVGGTANYTGGVCGYNYLGTISGCTNSAAVGGTANYTGGVCGMNSNGTISMCDNTAEVGGEAVYGIGGVCGYNGQNGTIITCSNAAKVGGTATYTGGVCGRNYNGKISMCDNTGEVDGENTKGIGCFGGVCGINGDIYGDSSRNLIIACRNTGKVSGKAKSEVYSGGVCGYSKTGMITGCYNTAEVYGESTDNFARCGGVNGNNSGRSTVCACYNIGKVGGVASNGDVKTGGVCGENFGKVSYCYWGGESSVLNKATGIDKDNGITDYSYKFGDGTNETGWPTASITGWGSGMTPTNWDDDLYGSWSNPWGSLGYWDNVNPVYPSEPQPDIPF